MKHIAIFTIALFTIFNTDIVSESYADEVVYENSFDSSPGPEWSRRSRSTTPLGGRRFLGQFGNSAVELTLQGLPSHDEVSLSFDLFVIRSWDGNAQTFQGSVIGPDIWTVEAGEATLLSTTFSNTLAGQSYPANYPAPDSPPCTGASERNTLGYTFNHPDIGLQPEDAVYRLSFSFEHASESIVFRFLASGLQEITDESWGIDNVTVRVTGEGSGRSPVVIIPGILGTELYDDETGELIWPDPKGDGTVTHASASAAPDTRVFYVREGHDNIPGNSAVHQKLMHILEGDPETAVEGDVSDTPYSSGESYRLHVLSPVTVSFEDSSGNYTGRDENDDILEEIPGSMFLAFEKNEAVLLPKDREYQVRVTALEPGAFTLLIDTVTPSGETIAPFGYHDVPMSGNGKARMLLTPESGSSELLLDIDGDEVDDFVLFPNEELPAELASLSAYRGDANHDDEIDISDPIAILSYLFLGRELACLSAADANKDGEIDISDPIRLLTFLFGPAELEDEKVYCPSI